LLLHNFHLQIDLPTNHLCPPVPNRLNYLCWLSELFEFEHIRPNVDQAQHSSIPLLDIGVGASCIYPLLGSRMYGWNFYGSDIDQESLVWAHQIVQMNNLQNSIKLVSVESSNSLQSRMWQLVAQLSKKIKQSKDLAGHNEQEDFTPIENERFKETLFQVCLSLSYRLTDPTLSDGSLHRLSEKV
jgi:23S rRNA A1618 N6-methylase RlmF